MKIDGRVHIEFNHAQAAAVRARNKGKRVSKWVCEKCWQAFTGRAAEKHKREGCK